MSICVIVYTTIIPTILCYLTLVLVELYMIVAHLFVIYGSLLFCVTILLNIVNTASTEFPVPQTE